MHRTGIEPMSTAWKAATLPQHQRCWEGLRSKRWISELSNLDFSWQIFWVSHQKKTKLFFEKLIFFSLTRLLCFSLIESCRFWFVTSQGQWEFKKWQEFTISWYFVPLTHTIVMLNLYLKLNILLPPVWVYASYGIRTHVNGLEGCYATTTPTLLRRFTIEEMYLRTFKLGFFLTNILSVTSEKTKTILWEADSFFANQTPLFLINRKLSFLVCYFSRTLGFQKETRIYYFMSILSP